MEDVYRIKRSLAVALIVDTALLVALLGVAFFKGNSPVEKVILSVFLVPLLLVTLEANYRRVTVSEKGLSIKKFFLKREFLWGDVTDVGAVILRNRVYLVLTTTKGFHIISNAYDGFSALVRGIVSHVEAERVEEHVKALVERPVTKVSDVVSAWAGAVVLLVVIYIRVFL
ncbi:MAG: hypothetical protein KBG01_02730 [Syntrophobacterales bacterium]|nr:hypothetical protein [Syntrophobacterales bacterium]